MCPGFYSPNITIPYFSWKILGEQHNIINGDIVTRPWKTFTEEGAAPSVHYNTKKIDAVLRDLIDHLESTRLWH